MKNFYNKFILTLFYFRLHRSHQPHFPIGIQERTFALVKQKLEDLQYNGPVALSCDDTKLLPSLHPYYDQDREGYFLMGHVGEPLQLLDHEAFRTVVKKNNLEKVTKVRKILELDSIY